MIKPLGQRVLIQPRSIGEKTKGGLYIPVESQKRMSESDVVLVSEEIESPKIKAGDVVVFDQYAGNKYERDNVEYVILNLDDIIAVVTD